MRNYKPQNYSKFTTKSTRSNYNVSPSNYKDNGKSGARNSYKGGLFGSRDKPMNEVNWRDSNDYRKEYFEKNRGFLGIYLCSQCYKPMISKSKIQVDHIVPPSRFARKKIKRNTKYNTSFVAKLLNNEFNAISICAPCNQSKSNKMGVFVVKGVIAKTIETGVKIAAGCAALSFIMAMGAMSLSFRTMRWAWRRAAH